MCIRDSLYDSFTHEGPNGTHVCMVFDVLGDNLLTLIKRYEYLGVPLLGVKALTRAMLKGLRYLHGKKNIIHTDLKPENVVFALTEREKFELLYEHVLCGPLIDLFETDQPIILNAKQLKN